MKPIYSKKTVIVNSQSPRKKLIEGLNETGYNLENFNKYIRLMKAE